MHSYDKFFFESFPNPERHINRLAVLGALFGVEPAPLTTARVLEIGCSTGMDSIAQALRYPNAYFTGIDISTAQIARGHEIVGELKLQNIALEAIDFREFSADQPFDYILCHGLFSWIPNELRKKLLEKISQLLAPEGVAYLSFNTRSAWRHREAVQNIIRLFDRAHHAPQQRIQRARQIQSQLKESLFSISGELPSRVRDELQRLDSVSDQLLLHEYLAEGFHTYSVAQIETLLNSAGLNYLADARPRRNHYRLISDLRPSAMRALFSRHAAAENEDIADQIEAKSFRAALISKKKGALTFSAEVIAELYMASPLVPMGDLFLMGNEEPVELVLEPVKEAILRLHEEWPRALPIRELFAQPFSQEIIAALQQLLWNQHIELSCDNFGCAAEVVDKPCVSPLARLQAREAKVISTLKHEYFLANDFEKRLLQQLDGSRSFSDLVADTENALANGDIQSEHTFDRNAIENIVRRALIELKERAMLL